MQGSVESDHGEVETSTNDVEEAAAEGAAAALRRSKESTLPTLPTSVGQPREKKRRQVVFATPAELDARRRKRRQIIADEESAARNDEAATGEAASSSSGQASSSHNDVNDGGGKANGGEGGQSSSADGMPCNSAPLRIQIEESQTLTQMFEETFEDERDDDFL